MKSRKIISIVSCLFLGLMSSHANAAVITVSYAGTLASGTDELGIFGTAGDSLAALPFTMTFTYDTSIGRTANANTGTDPSSYDVSYGGSYYGMASPLVSATLTINGISQAMQGGTTADVGYWDYGSDYFETTAIATPYTSTPGGTVVYSDAVFGNFLPIVINSVDDSFSATNLNGALALTDASGATADYSGYFDFYTTGGTGVGTTGQIASGVDITVTGLSALAGFRQSLLATSPAPEPAAWAMMVIGLGFVGAMQRRRLNGRMRYAMA